MPHAYTILVEHRTRLHVFLVEDDEGRLASWDLETETFLPLPQVDQAEWRFIAFRHREASPPLPQVEAQ